MIPNLFSKLPVPDKIPGDMSLLVNYLKKSKNKEDCLKKTFAIMTSKYHGNKLYVYFLMHRLFETDVNRLWKRNGFLPCTSFCYLTRILLIKSGFFCEEVDGKIEVSCA